MDIRVLFGKNLRRFRLQAGLSQEAVAERMSVDRAHVSSMERGLQNVTLLTIWEAAQAVTCAPADLLAAVGDEPVAAAGVVKAPRRRRTKS